METWKKILNSLKNPQTKLIAWIIIISAVFLFGYYLRAYFSLYKPLPFSPYDAFFEANLFKDSLHQHLDQFSAKALEYPVGYYLSLWLRTFFTHIYIIYIAGCLLFYFIGKEISGSRLGGALALFAYAVGSENLIQYSGIAYPSGLCHISILAALLSLLKYLKSDRKVFLIAFFLASLLALTSYHTGAVAYLAIMLGILAAMIFSKFNIDKKFLISFLLLALFYALMILKIDLPQINLISGALSNINWLIFFPAATALALLAAFAIFILRDIKRLRSEYLPLLALFPAAFLIFAKIDFFSPLLQLGAANYYSTAVTLNNYLAQALLLHIYFISMLGKIYAPTEDKKILLIRGWIIGLAIISLGLILEHYFSRILDYTFPLMFILFGWYWSEHAKFRKTVVFSTIALLIISQLMIFNDPFSMRRYYNQNEIDSAKNIVSLDLNGVMISDLRTTALLNYLGDKNAAFPPDDRRYSLLFYKFEKLTIAKLALKSYPHIYYPSYAPDYYLVLSQSMKTIIYSTNFETEPLTDKIFDYYDGRFKKVYDDGLMRVYLIHERQYE